MSTEADEAPLTQEEVSARGASFDTVEPLIEAMYYEISSLSGKKPEMPVNANKIKVANRLFTEALAILEGEPSRQYLELIDPDDMPQNSDMVLTLRQFKTALHAFKRRYYTNHRWVADEEEYDVDEGSS